MPAGSGYFYVDGERGRAFRENGTPDPFAVHLRYQNGQVSGYRRDKMTIAMSRYSVVFEWRSVTFG